MYLGFLLALLAVATILAALGLALQRPGEEKPRRPLPYPSARAHPADLRTGRHHAEDAEPTQRLWPMNGQTDRS